MRFTRPVTRLYSEHVIEKRGRSRRLGGSEAGARYPCIQGANPHLDLAINHWAMFGVCEQEALGYVRGM